MHGLGRRRWPRALSFRHVAIPQRLFRSVDAESRLLRAPAYGKRNLHGMLEAGMITPAYLRTMAAYNAEMNRRLYAAAGRLSETERRAPKGAFWGSIHGTLVHILWGDGQWMSRFDDWQRPAAPIRQSDHFIEDWAELCAARDKADADISRWADKVDEAWLGEDLVWFSSAAEREIRAP